jgi:hypothetical protein
LALMARTFKPLHADAIANRGANFLGLTHLYWSGLTAGEMYNSTTWNGARNSLRDLNNPMPIHADEPLRYATLLRNSIKLPLH